MTFGNSWDGTQAWILRQTKMDQLSCKLIAKRSFNKGDKHHLRSAPVDHRIGPININSRGCCNLIRKFGNKVHLDDRGILLCVKIKRDTAFVRTALFVAQHCHKNNRWDRTHDHSIVMQPCEPLCHQNLLGSQN